MLSANIRNFGVILVLPGSFMGRVEALMWIRTKKTSFNFGDYTNLDTDSWDALKFKAKRDVLFCVIGMLKNWESKAFVLEMKYRIVSADEEEGATT